MRAARPPAWSLLGLALSLCLGSAVVAEAPPSEARIAALKQAAEDAETKRKELEAAAGQSETQLKEARGRLDQVKTDAEKAAKTLPELEKTQAEQQTALTQAQEAKAKADAALEAARKAAEEAAAKSKAAETALGETQAAVEKAKQTVAAAPNMTEELQAAVVSLETQHKQNAELLATASAAALKSQKDLESALIAAGQLVSFSEKIAPIFAQRCLACHNARSAKGRLNLETYAALMKGGESGEAVTPGSGEFSNLTLLVEDGTMPKDADPLKPEQVAVIRKWIDTGAALDAGMDPQAPLITIMPKPTQPDPPATYRVAIPVTALAFSPDGGLLASSGYHEILLWNPADGRLVRRIPNVAERVYDLAFSNDGKTLAVAAGTPGRMGEVKLFRVEDGSLLRDLLTTGDSVFAVAFSPDGQRIAAAGADRSVRVFDAATGAEQLLIEDHADWVMDIAWSGDGTKLASASRDKTSKVFDAKTGDSLVTFNGHGEPVFGVGFLADGSQVVTSGRDKQLRVWAVADAKEARKIGGFGDEVFRIAVTPDNHVFSVSADKTARLHLATDGKAVRTFSGHADWVYALSVHTESKRLATGGYDGEVRIWNAGDGKVVTSWIAAPGHQKPEQAAMK
ncbi:MAG: c-type cytochrome domain-containing protein [Planctomycetaceae bacterium]